MGGRVLDFQLGRRVGKGRLDGWNVYVKRASEVR